MNALMLNCTLKKSPDESNTQALLDRIARLFDEHGVTAESVRCVDFVIEPGVMPTALSDADEWPTMLKRVKAADILVMATPTWFGHRSSVCQRVLERLDGSLSETDDLGQTPFFGKVAGVVITGNEDGAHHIAEGVLFNFTHLGFTIPPMVDCYWNGPSGPGKSYIAAGGQHHTYTNKTARYMVAGLVHMAHALISSPFRTNYSDLANQAQAESDPAKQQFI